MTRYETVAATYSQYDRQVYDYCKEGLAHYRFHPDGLPGRETLLPLAAFDSGREHLQNAQRRFSQIVHHAAWLSFWNELVGTGVPQREGDKTGRPSPDNTGPTSSGFMVPYFYRVSMDDA